MPVMDGYSVCRRIREGSQIPIIMVTSATTDEEKTIGLNAGANDYVSKPFSADELLTKIRAMLNC